VLTVKSPSVDELDCGPLEVTLESDATVTGTVDVNVDDRSLIDDTGTIVRLAHTLPGIDAPSEAIAPTERIYTLKGDESPPTTSQ
jgi:hypothetical protein